MFTSFQLRELFHLLVLRALSLRLVGRPFSLKGGACLRFFHRSPRFSEDMDIDVSPQIRLPTLQKAVDGILSGRSLLAALAPNGVLQLDISKPKQTETTERWKVNLVVGPDSSVPTKIEFSRRSKTVSFKTGVPDSEILNRYKIPPFAAPYCDTAHMSAQKIGALSSPNRLAVRDLFDLDHLFFQMGEKAGPIVVDSKTIESALEKLGSFGFSDFQEQVAPFLTEEMTSLYKKRDAFDQMKNRVQTKLVGMLK